MGSDPENERRSRPLPWYLCLITYTSLKKQGESTWSHGPPSQLGALPHFPSPPGLHGTLHPPPHPTAGPRPTHGPRATQWWSTRRPSWAQPQHRGPESSSARGWEPRRRRGSARRLWLLASACSTWDSTAVPQVYRERLGTPSSQTGPASQELSKNSQTASPSHGPQGPAASLCSGTHRTSSGAAGSGSRSGLTDKASWALQAEATAATSCQHHAEHCDRPWAP